MYYLNFSTANREFNHPFTTTNHRSPSPLHMLERKSWDFLLKPALATDHHSNQSGITIIPTNQEASPLQQVLSITHYPVMGRKNALRSLSQKQLISGHLCNL
ncbi:hypothetical protein TNCT_330211 [Trichonephila clavata]|uniref:Uncharacterized protein n=1 Tax=Trichonephila clavata TaxID=2740835 RepID=A0A8X6M272_TRICU|nr:hypothetical protein TNCT_330211 [Trichonephila clavata]